MKFVIMRFFALYILFGVLTISTGCDKVPSEDLYGDVISMSTYDANLITTEYDLIISEPTTTYKPEKFPFPFEIDNKVLNDVLVEKYGLARTEKDFYESLNEISLSVIDPFSKNDIEALKYCKKLSLELLASNDLSLFSKLDQLEQLNIVEGEESAFVVTEIQYLNDYSFLRSLSNLRELRIINAELDISLLENMDKLEKLTVGESKITIENSFALNSVKYICFAYCCFDDLNVLLSFSNIRELVMDGCSFPKEQLSVLNKLLYLENIDLSHCNLSELSDLSLLNNLKQLNVYTFFEDKYPPKMLLSNLPERLETLIVCVDEFPEEELNSLNCTVLSYYP